MRIFSVGYDKRSHGMTFNGLSETDAGGFAWYHGALESGPAGVLGGLLRSDERNVDESFDFDDVSGTVQVGGEVRPVARINASRPLTTAELLIHLDYAMPGDDDELPSGNLTLALLTGEQATVLGQIRRLHELGVTDADLVVAVLRSGVSSSEVESLFGGEQITDQLDGLRVLAALREESESERVQVAVSDDRLSVVIHPAVPPRPYRHANHGSK